jgi:endonuclease YncB( thermonuclease family)
MRWRNVQYEWAGVAFLLAVLFTIHYFKPEWTEFVVEPQQQRPNSYHAIDGDSFKAGETEIRLHGIDAPEYRQTCIDKQGKGQPCGKLARDALSSLIRTRTVKCTIVDRDRYGRQVSVCKDGTLEINREMVRLGWAIAYRKHALNYVPAEREAKAARRGIWAWEFERPEDYRAKNRAVQGSAVGDVFKDE